MQNESSSVERKKYDPNNPLLVGGQAVIEGVMMKAPGAIATAVRRASGQIELKIDPFKSIMEKYKILKLPIIRGGVGLIEMMIIGIKTLNFSADIAMQDEELKNQDKKDKKDKEKSETKKKSNNSNISIFFTMLIAFALGIAIFFILPLFLTTKVFNIEKEAFLFNLVAGVIRISILLIYIIAISYLKDIRRIFQYHGAEHKSVLTFEGNRDLTIESTKDFSTFHPRCGTSFIFGVMLVAIVTFAFLDALIIHLLGNITLAIRLAFHLPFIPFLGGIAYEFMKFSSRHTDKLLGKILIAPGLWLQRITTQEPDDSQIEVALCALNAALNYKDEQSTQATQGQDNSSEK
jgi:uncharacterized protein YqhQ